MRQSRNQELSIPSPGADAGYGELAKAHILGHGGDGHIVSRRETPSQWRAWMAYFDWLDGQTVPRGRKGATFRTIPRFTAPTAWPLEFDVGAPPSQPFEPEPLIGSERRRQLADMLRGVVGIPPGGLGRRRSDAEDPRDGRRKPFSLELDEGQDAFADRPLHTSVELRGQLKPQPAEVIDDAIDEEITF